MNAEDIKIGEFYSFDVIIEPFTTKPKPNCPKIEQLVGQVLAINSGNPSNLILFIDTFTIFQEDEHIFSKSYEHIPKCRTTGIDNSKKLPFKTGLHIFNKEITSKVTNYKLIEDTLFYALKTAVIKFLIENKYSFYDKSWTRIVVKNIKNTDNNLLNIINVVKEHFRNTLVKTIIINYLPDRYYPYIKMYFPDIDI